MTFGLLLRLSHKAALEAVRSRRLVLLYPTADDAEISSRAHCGGIWVSYFSGSHGLQWDEQYFHFFTRYLSAFSCTRPAASRVGGIGQQGEWSRRRTVFAGVHALWSSEISLLASTRLNRCARRELRLPFSCSNNPRELLGKIF